MKQVYSFYYTGEEHRTTKSKGKTYLILTLVFFFYFICLGLIAVFFKSIGYQMPDPYPYLYIGLTFSLIIPFSIFLFLFIFSNNKNPTQEFWNGKQEYTIEGNKVTIHITMPNGLSKTDEFFIENKVEKPEGTYLYKQIRYFIFIPSRVKPTIVND